MSCIKDKVVVITGGTGSLGKVLTRRLLSREQDLPRKIIIFSRDETKQQLMRSEYQGKRMATDEIIYQDFGRLVEFRIGDIRNYYSVCAVLDGADIVINAAALKQVPSCEYYPYEAVQTNIIGAENIVRAIHLNNLPVETVIGVSTDKACKPINVMGMSKAIQERVMVNANIRIPSTRFICVRYSNVLASRGSVIPLFHEQIKAGGPLTITTPDMTRFLLSPDRAVDTILEAIAKAFPGETYVPLVPSVRILDVAAALIGDREIPTVFTGIRPGEKVHEILVSQEEAGRTFQRGEYLVIKPLLPELWQNPGLETIAQEYSSEDSVLSLQGTRILLQEHHLLDNAEIKHDGEFLW